MAKDSNGDDLNEKKDNAEENFGLPDIEYKPLDQPAAAESNTTVEASEPAPAPLSSGGDSGYSDSEAYSADPPKSKAPVILGVVIVLVILVAGYLIYDFVYKPAQLEKARKEQEARDAKALKEKQDREEAERKRLAEEERKRLEAIANAKPVIGTIETLSGRTKRYYVVVTSDIDDDLLMDFAKKLSAKGISTKIIPPYGDKKFFRLAVADHDNWTSAQTNADAVKADYGAGVWVLKY